MTQNFFEVTPLFVLPLLYGHLLSDTNIANFSLLHPSHIILFGGWFSGLIIIA